MAYHEDGDAVHFIVHTDIIKENCSYFRRVLSEASNEGPITEITFDEDSPESVAILLDYIYCRRVAPFASVFQRIYVKTCCGSPDSTNYIGAWILAYRLDEERMQNKVIDEIRKYYRCNLPTIDDLRLLVAKDVTRDPIGRISFDIAFLGLFGSFDYPGWEALEAAHNKEPDDSVIMQEAAFRAREGRSGWKARINHLAGGGTLCYYHEHTVTPRCG